MTAVDDRQRGLYGKYCVERADGKDKGPYFVLAYTSDPHAAVALAAYAKSCEGDYPMLAADLREALQSQPGCECGEAACQWCAIHSETGNPRPHDPYGDEGLGVRHG
ncbi:hypothetical protein [Mycobacterium talmoniae]|uniref:Uncharacterized protein n=1 Tax=Mycobacterium talmoniae TaxID=1858794 RepID=A0A1S1NDJ6_9MYCO|nr:hypothetical protein [Mycobacterium talmoniae]OHV03700.1 hypothetical protein BKN37_13585 [Mycobacterium talmoniae]